MTEPIAEAYELVEHGVITEREFRELTFLNPVRLHAGGNPASSRARCAKRRRSPRWPRTATDG